MTIFVVFEIKYVNSWDEKLLQDADLLDHYGSQGIWMSISYYAYTTQQEMNQVPEFYMGEWQKQIADRMEIEKNGTYSV